MASAPVLQMVSTPPDNRLAPLSPSLYNKDTASLIEKKNMLRGDVKKRTCKFEFYCDFSISHVLKASGTNRRKKEKVIVF